MRLVSDDWALIMTLLHLRLNELLKSGRRLRLHELREKKRIVKVLDYVYDRQRKAYMSLFS